MIAPRAEWRQDLAGHALHHTPPVGAPYVLGLWHKDRATWRGYAFEARVWAKSLLVRNHPQKFLMVGRPRSGTSLLQGLLHQVEGIHCDGEVLHSAVLAPRAFLNRLAGIKHTKVYGAKFLTYQMLEVQKLRDVPGFFQALIADGFTLVHVRRDTFAQSLSLTVAQQSSRYHIRKGAPGGTRSLTIAPELFARQLRHNREALAYEDRLLSQLPHLRVQYENDLKAPECHQPTIDRLCQAFGIAPTPVAANFSKVSDKTEVVNLDALRAVATAEGVA